MATRRKCFIDLNFDENHQFITNNLLVLKEILERDYSSEGGPYGFKNAVFEMRDGRSTHGENDEPDFICGGIEIKWYKHIGRGMEISREASFDELDAMFHKCRVSLRKRK